MSGRDTFYDGADRAIRAMNRENLKTFGRLKTRVAKFDELHVIREVRDVYDTILRTAERWLMEVARDAYMRAMKEAGERKRNPVDRDWILDWLEETDFVALYRFIPEWERKKARLIEALPAAQNPAQEIDKALRAWTKQIGWFAVAAADRATQQAFEDAKVTEVEWVSERDDRVCDICEGLDGKVFKIEDVPPKPHWGCRCHLRFHRVSGG